MPTTDQDLARNTYTFRAVGARHTFEVDRHLAEEDPTLAAEMLADMQDQMEPTPRRDRLVTDALNFDRQTQMAERLTWWQRWGLRTEEPHRIFANVAERTEIVAGQFNQAADRILAFTDKVKRVADAKKATDEGTLVITKGNPFA